MKQALWLFLLASSAFALTFIYRLIRQRYHVCRSPRALITKAFLNLKQLNNDVFACFLQADYPDNIYLYERRLHIKKYTFLKTLERLRHLQFIKNDCHQQSLQTLQQLFYIIIDAAALRYRITDHHVFSICQRELKNILLQMDEVFVAAASQYTKHKSDLNIDRLMEKIERLEENFHHILKISTQDPLVFLLFINSVRAFALAVCA